MYLYKGEKNEFLVKLFINIFKILFKKSKIIY
jgi:hypothetical protein